MKVETKDLENRQVQLTVEVPQDKVQAAMRAAARRLGKSTRIPGFRPGKAPYEILLHRLGEDTVFEEALEGLGQEVYRQALEDAALEPFAPGIMEEVISRSPLVLRYTVPLAPEIELGEYRELRIPYEEPEIEDEAVDEAMDELRQSQALIEPAERPAQMGDVLVVDVQVTLREPGEDEPTTLLTEEGVSLLLEEDLDWPIPGIAQSLVGMEAGQERDLEHTFPEDYRSEELRGRVVDVHVKCHEVKSRLVPEWSDELAKNLGDFESLLDLRIKVREGLQEAAERRVREEYAQKVVEAVVDAAKVSYPPTLLNEEINDMLMDLARQLRSQNLSLEDYLKIEGKSEQELYEELKPRAEERLKRALVLGKIVEVEGLTVSDEEIDQEIEAIAEPFGKGAENLRKAFNTPDGRNRIRMRLLTTKAIDRLIAIARGEEIEPAAVAQAEPPETSAESAATSEEAPQVAEQIPQAEPNEAEEKEIE